MTSHNYELHARRSSVQIVERGSLKYCVPRELYCLVLEQVDTLYYRYSAILRSLMLTSRAWRYEAERVRYRDISVREGYLLPFCQKLAARPDLIRVVEKLGFYTGALDEPSEEDKALVVHTLRSLTNLKELVEYAGSGHDLIGPNDYHVYVGLPCKLERWKTCLFWREELFAILRTQPDLRQLDCEWSSQWEHLTLPPDVLRKCTILRTGPRIMRCFGPSRPPIRHLTFSTCVERPGQELEWAREIRLVGDNLISLVIMRMTMYGVEYVPMPSLIAQFADWTPNLYTLALLDEFNFSPRDNRRIREIVSSHFPKLRTLVWAPLCHGRNTLDTDDWDESDEDGDLIESDDESDEETGVRMTSVDKAAAYAAQLFSAHPTLQYFAAALPATNLFKRIPDPDAPGGFHVERTTYCLGRIDYNYTAHFIDPNAPEDYIIYSKFNPNRFDIPPDPPASTSGNAA